MIDRLKQFIKEAGQYSLEQRRLKGQNLSFKAGNDLVKGIVTEVDITISQNFKKFIEDNFSHLNYLIIDEESIAELGNDIFSRCNETDYQFVIDPIDGTINYASEIPLYGITIGVLRNGKPWLGLVYAPALGELVYTNGEQVFYEIGDDKGKLAPASRSMARIVMAHSWRVRVKPDHFHGKLVVQDYFSAVIYCLYMVLGRIKGCFVKANLWDVAGGWAICKLLGIGFYDYYSGKETVEFSPEFFETSCQFKRLQICCYQDDFEELKALPEDILEP